MTLPQDAPHATPGPTGDEVPASSLRILAPVLVDFHLVPGSNHRRASDYAAFWNSAHDLVSTGDGAATGRGSFAFPHASARTYVNLYQDIGDHSEGTTVHVVSGHICRGDLELDEEAYLDLVPPGTEVRFDVFDHGIMLLDLVVPLADFRRTHGEGGDALDRLEKTAVAAGEALARAVQQQVLDPLLDALRGLQRATRAEVVQERDPDLCDPVDVGAPLWVTRTLHLSPDDPGAHEMLSHWLRHVEAHTDNDADALVGGRATSNITWLNYALMSPDPASAGSPQHAEWQGLRFAQYYYAALDRVDSVLAQVLAETTASTARAHVKSLRELLVRLSQRADLIVMDRHRVSKYLPRAVRTSMDAVLDGWDHDHLVEQPVQYKLEVCRRQLDELERRRSARASVVTDLILLCIGITSILATALALTDFGRSTAGDPHLTGTGGSSLVAWVSAQPADAILISSGVISLAAVAVYFFFRSDTDG